MISRRKALRLGSALIACALLLRLADTGLFSFLFPEERGGLPSLLLYLETGRIVRPPEPTAPPPAAQPAPAETEPPQTPQPWEFFPEDASLADFYCTFDYAPDPEELLSAPLRWDLRQEQPTVLILHTHATESYLQEGETYEESALFHTLEPEHNMISVGERLAELLEAGGIRVIHDCTVHDYPSYTAAYENSRATAVKQLEAHPEIVLVLDLHRDAAEDAAGNQVAVSSTVHNLPACQLMLVCGSDAGGLDHPRWQENLALAVKLQTWLVQHYPGLCRPVRVCGQRYNQDLLPGYLLVEVGAAGNTREQALRTMDALSEAILALAAGSTFHS